jgi:hypothetical protein
MPFFAYGSGKLARYRLPLVPNSIDQVEERCTITVRSQKHASKHLILNEFMVRRGVELLDDPRYVLHNGGV